MRVPLSYGTALFGFTDEGAATVQRSGVVSISRGNPAPVFPFSIQTESKSDMMTYVYEMGRIRGGTRPVLLVRDPTDTDYRMQTMQYGVLSGEMIAIENSFNFYTFRSSIRGMS